MLEQIAPKAMKKDGKFLEWFDAPMRNRNLVERSELGYLANASDSLNTTESSYFDTADSETTLALSHRGLMLRSELKSIG